MRDVRTGFECCIIRVERALTVTRPSSQTFVDALAPHNEKSYCHYSDISLEELYISSDVEILEILVKF